MNKLSRLIKGKWLSYLKEGSTFRWYRIWENAIYKREQPDRQIIDWTAFKILFSSAQETEEMWVLLLNSQLSSLDSVLCSILPDTLNQQKKPLGSCYLCLKSGGSTRCPTAQAVWHRLFPYLCVPQCDEGTRPPRKEPLRHGGGKGPHFSAWEGRDPGRVRNSPQLAVQHQGWTRGVLLPNLAVALAAKASEKGKDFRTKL